MPTQNEAISCNRAEIYVVPSPDDGGDPFLLGIVEDFTVTGNFSAEVLMSIGKFTGVDTVVNNKQARFRWGKVEQVNDRFHGIIAPVVARYASWKAFDLLVVDIVDVKPILRLVHCAPEMLEIAMSNGRALRENFQGVALDLEIGQAVITSS